MRNTSEKPRENQCKEWLGGTLPKRRNSCRIDAQNVRNTSQKTAERYLRIPKERVTWRNASETAEQLQDWCPNCTKHEPENCRTLPKEGVKKLEGLRPKPCETRPKSQWKINERNDLEKRLRNSGTAAGLMPKLYETRARKLPNVTEGTRKKARRIEAQTMRNTTEKPMENQCKEWLGETLPKQRNSSRIDAQTVRNTSQKTAERYLRNA